MANLPPVQPQQYPTRQQLAILRKHLKRVRAVAFSPDSRYLAFASENYRVRLWELESQVVVDTLKGHASDVSSIAFSPTSKVLASGSKDKTIQLWDSTSGAHLTTLQGHSEWVSAVAFSPDGDRLASASGDDTIRLWETSSWTEVAALKAGIGGQHSVAFSPDGKRLVSGSFNNVYLWDATTGAQLTTLKGHRGPVNSVSFSSDGTILASGSQDNTIRLWGAVSGTRIATLKGHSGGVNAVAFSPDGAILASGSVDGSVRAWEVASRSIVATLADDLNWVGSVAFSPDGSRIASGSSDRTVRLWNIPRVPSPSRTVTPVRPATISDKDYAAISVGHDLSGPISLLNNSRIVLGGFWDLFLGEHMDLGKVALKRPNSLLDVSSIKAIFREVDLLCEVSHRHILPWLGVCRIGQAVYVASPFIESRDLMTCIDRGVVLDRGKLLYQSAEGLAHLHGRGIVHGNFKGQNVLLSDDGSALLCDFGLAETLDSIMDSTAMMKTMVARSLRWMAPEMFYRTGRARSTATDVYSFGITVSEVLSGYQPYSHLAEDGGVLIYVILNNGRPTKQPQCSPEGQSYSVLWEAAEKCWVKEANDRPQMTEVLGMLSSLTGGET